MRRRKGHPFPAGSPSWRWRRSASGCGSPCRSPWARGRSTSATSSPPHVPWKAFGAAELRQGRNPGVQSHLGAGPSRSGAIRTHCRSIPATSSISSCPSGAPSISTMPCTGCSPLRSPWPLLARGLGQERPAALVAGITYARLGLDSDGAQLLQHPGRGRVVAAGPSSAPRAAAGGESPSGGSPAALALLAGEPVTASLGLLPLLLVARPEARARGAVSSPRWASAPSGS